MRSYEEWRVGSLVADLKSRTLHNGQKLTHRWVINNLEALRLPSLASWYWQDAGLQSEADLDREIA